MVFLDMRIQNVSSNSKRVSFLPFIIASSFKVKDEESEVKLEYIVPQFVTQYLTGSDQFDGIIYSSTVSGNVDTPSCRSDNVVFPTHVNGDKEYDMDLLEKFDIAEPQILDCAMFQNMKDKDVRREMRNMENNLSASLGVAI